MAKRFRASELFFNDLYGTELFKERRARPEQVLQEREFLQSRSLPSLPNLRAAKRMRTGVAGSFGITSTSSSSSNDHNKSSNSSSSSSDQK